VADAKSIPGAGFLVEKPKHGDLSDTAHGAVRFSGLRLSGSTVATAHPNTIRSIRGEAEFYGDKGANVAADGRDALRLYPKLTGARR